MSERERERKRETDKERERERQNKYSKVAGLPSTHLSASPIAKTTREDRASHGGRCTFRGSQTWTSDPAKTCVGAGVCVCAVEFANRGEPQRGEKWREREEKESKKIPKGTRNSLASQRITPVFSPNPKKEFINKVLYRVIKKKTGIWLG